jgi:hypothetical protein
MRMANFKPVLYWSNYQLHLARLQHPGSMQSSEKKAVINQDRSKRSGCLT